MNDLTVLRWIDDPDQVLIDALPHLRALSVLTHELIFATVYRSGIGQYDFLDIKAEYISWSPICRHELRCARIFGVNRKGRLNFAKVVMRGGIVMASRGIDNVTDVCEAMRADLARRMEECESTASVTIAVETAEGDE